MTSPGRPSHPRPGRRARWGGTGHGLPGHQRVAAGLAAHPAGGRGGGGGPRLRAEPRRPRAGHPADRRRRPGHLLERGPGLCRTVLRRGRARHQRRRHRGGPAAAARPQRVRRATAGALPHATAHRRSAPGVAARRRPAARAAAGPRGLPVVLGGRPPRGYDGAYVDVDNAGGARAGVTYLLERGRHRIATITGPPDMGAGRDRLAGYRTALADAGLPDEPGLVEAGTFSELSGERAMRALLARHEDLDAVFAANDSMAVGALRALRDTGRTVPDDVAVVGFDDSPLSRVTEPLLSTVRQPVDGMGRAMAEMLLGLIAGGDGDVRHRAVLPTELVVRGSS